MITLSPVTPALNQQREHRFLLDTFGDCFQVEGLRHLYDRGYDARIYRVVDHTADKRLVNLQAIHGESLQIRQTRIARAEIID